MTVYLVYGQTESCDDWRLVFSYRPTREDIIYEINDNPWLRDEFYHKTLGGWEIVAAKVIED